MAIEHHKDFIKIQDTLIRISKIDSVKMRTVSKPNNFGKVSDESFPEIIIGIGADMHVFVFENVTAQLDAFKEINKIITDK